MLFLIAAAQLSAADLLDLRCVYVFQTVASATTGEDRQAAKWTQQWFEGRLSARHPHLNVDDYVSKYFVFRKVASSSADLEQCSQTYTSWAAEQIVGQLRK